MGIDMGLMRSLVTLAAFVTFIGIVVWAWSGARRKRFEAAARLPLEDAEAESNAGTAGSDLGRGESRGG
ncbi:MAG: cbb3-type cytochrome c oxidase subunit 3 [Betaproteobacteria bacterium]|nr:cbb3-type cytochrome c oxidase subunit 3 [Betaproteobacteria bacterium]MDH3437697.1 cbb3-type cytochrome c oxidase subunit 3 [Betaproteobacteria bacterium]